MSETIVVYKSKYGSTKKHAEWIANTLGSELVMHKKINIETLKKFDTIIKACKTCGLLIWDYLIILAI